MSDDGQKHHHVLSVFVCSNACKIIDSPATTSQMPFCLHVFWIGYIWMVQRRATVAVNTHENCGTKTQWCLCIICMNTMMNESSAFTDQSIGAFGCGRWSIIVRGDSLVECCALSLRLRTSSWRCVVCDVLMQKRSRIWSSAWLMCPRVVRVTLTSVTSSDRICTPSVTVFTPPSWPYL